MNVHRFNIRVYGLLVHAGHVLVSDEVVQGKRITKFPGGGMELGEGTLECLVREVREEMGAEAVDLQHFYTTDFFQPSAFREGDQIISIYYTFRVARRSGHVTGIMPFANNAISGESFRWLPLDGAGSSDVDLPIDRVVLGMLLQKMARGRRVNIS